MSGLKEKVHTFIAGTLAVAVIAAVCSVVIGLAIGAQYVCVNHYAPWMLGTDDKQAIAFYCKPTGGK